MRDAEERGYRRETLLTERFGTVQRVHPLQAERFGSIRDLERERFKVWREKGRT